MVLRKLYVSRIKSLEAENKELKDKASLVRAKNAEADRRLAYIRQMEESLIARSQQYDSTNPRIRRKIRRLQKSMAPRIVNG